jgi:hypothetical protein
MTRERLYLVDTTTTTEKRVAPTRNGRQPS